MYKTITVALIVLFLFSCNRNLKTNSDYFTIKGKISNPKEVSISLQTDDEIYFCDLENNGAFHFEIKSTAPTFYRLQLGDRGLPMYSEPGQVDSVSCKESFSNDLKYFGDNTYNNQYLIDRILTLDNVQSNAESFYVCDSKIFTGKLDSLFNIFNNEIKQNADSFSLAFKHLCLVENDCKYIEFLYSYPKAYQYFTEADSVHLHSSFYSKLKEIDINNAANLPSPAFRKYLHKILSDSVGVFLQNKHSLDDNYNKHYIAGFKVINKLFSNQDIINIIAGELMIKRLKDHKDHGVDLLMNDFEKICKSTEYKQKVYTQYEKWKQLQVGEPAPDFICYDVIGNKKELNDFKGKIILIDVWASWCKPCIKQFSRLEELKGLFPSIQFISISVDEDKTLWKEALKKYNLNKNQYIVSDGWNSDFLKDYQIHSIPRLILIDAAGKIINANLENSDIEQELLKKI